MAIVLAARSLGASLVNGSYLANMLCFDFSYSPLFPKDQNASFTQIKVRRARRDGVSGLDGRAARMSPLLASFGTIHNRETTS